LSRIISKRLGVTLVALVVVAASFFPLFAGPHDVRATRLSLVAETSFIGLSEPTELTLRAIDDSGRLDTSREDLVELSLKSLSYNVSAAKLSATSTRLEEGVGSVYIQGSLAEVVDVTVTWKGGQSALKSFTLRLFVGIGEE